MNKRKRSNQPESDDTELEMWLRAWRANHPDATLTDFEEEIDRELAKLRKRLVATMFEERDGPVECTECGQEMRENDRKRRQLQMKGGEVVTFERSQMRCPECGRTLFPPG